MEDLSFGTAVELNIAMGLSWLPLISDYTRTLKKPISGTILCVTSYGCGSTFMFVIGLGAAIYAGTSDFGVILLSAGFGLLALIVITFSTLTTTFMDTYSIGVNASTMYGKFAPKVYSTFTCIIATTIAIFVPMSQYENFLYLIGSVFSPLFTILLIDFFVFAKKDTHALLSGSNLLLWLAGFILYRLLMDYSSIAGTTLPVMLVIGVICFAANKLRLLYKR
jgi:putative hydroxymethylpyrimidine transporter CytX